MRHMIESGVAAVLGFALAGSSMPAFAQPAIQPISRVDDVRLTTFLDHEFAEELKLRPQLATRLGVKEGQDRLDDISDKAVLARLEWRRASVARMKAQFDRGKLSQADQANYDIWALELDRAELGYRFRKYQPPFYSFLYSVHSELPNFLINTHTVQDVSDMQAYNSRIVGISAVLDTAIARSLQSDGEGIRAPKFEVERVIEGSRTIITGAPFDSGADSPLWADAKAKLGRLQSSGKVTPAQAEALRTTARAALLSIKPAYNRVIAWAQSELATAPTGRVGAVSLPGGLDWYAAALKINTTTDLTAQEVHQIGMKEVIRIQAEQDTLARHAGFKDRRAYYADRAQLFPARPWTEELRAEYLKRANEAIAHTRTLLPGYFGLLPLYRVEVVREPSFSEVAGGAAHAAGPSPDGVRAGRVYVHLVGTTGDPAAVYDLMCHEGIPGHVMQGDIQVRQTGGPKFRKGYGYVAFAEGWGLYSEALCKEMGSYPDIAADFLRLDAELFRAARLVVDTGLHAEGWTEERAVDYMIETGRTSSDQARSEVRRYITLPGQATGYKVGMMRILDLRRRAEHELGSKFDIKGFHDLLIGSGSMPLAVLERRVDGWIAARK